MALIQQWLGLEDSNGKPVPQLTSRFPNGVRKFTPPAQQPKAASGGSSGSGNTYQGLKDAGYQVAKTNPSTGLTVLNKPSSSGSSGGSGGSGGNGCQPFDIPCHLKGLNLNLPPIIPGVSTEVLLVGGIGIVILYLVIR